MDLYIGTAGWQVNAAQAGDFPADGTHLQRYALRMTAAEINSSFYRPHATATYATWRDQTPPGFRFSVKLPKTITHQARLRDVEHLTDEFLAQVSGLGDRLGCLLVQLPPSLAFDVDTVQRFLRMFRQRYSGALAMEPRHASWFNEAADAVLARHRVARVLADPQLDPRGALPGGWPRLIYLRLHGSPCVYTSAYDAAWLQRLAERIVRARREADALWCIFDNTAAGHALGNALALQSAIRALDAADHERYRNDSCRRMAGAR